MARRSDHSREELREMAITAAEQIVVEQGYEGLSARKVAAAIGYTVGTLYLVFREAMFEYHCPAVRIGVRKLNIDLAQLQQAVTGIFTLCL